MTIFKQNLIFPMVKIFKLKEDYLDLKKGSIYGVSHEDAYNYYITNVKNELVPIPIHLTENISSIQESKKVLKG
jgi:hypothetical protein